MVPYKLIYSMQLLGGKGLEEVSALQKRCSANEDVVDRSKVLIKSSVLRNEDIAVEARKFAQQYRNTRAIWK